MVKTFKTTMSQIEFIFNYIRKDDHNVNIITTENYGVALVIGLKHFKHH